MHGIVLFRELTANYTAFITVIHGISFNCTPLNLQHKLATGYGVISISFFIYALILDTKNK